MTNLIRLENILNEEAARLRDFLIVLQHEQEALLSGSVDRLLSLAEEKNTIFTRLAEFGEARNQILKANALSADRTGVETWLAQYDPQATAHETWKTLLSMTVEAQELNRVNGTLINTRLANNQQALSTLLAAANQAALYGPDGQARPVGSGRSLGSF